MIGEIDVTSNLSCFIFIHGYILMLMFVVDVVVGDICRKSAPQIRRQGVSRVATSVKAKVRREESCKSDLWSSMLVQGCRY